MRIGSNIVVECTYDTSDLDVMAVEGHLVVKLILLFCFSMSPSRAGLKICVFIRCFKIFCRRDGLFTALKF